MKSLFIAIDHQNINVLEDLRLAFNRDNNRKFTTRQFVSYMVNRWISEGKVDKNELEKSRSENSGEGSDGRAPGEIQNEIRDRRRGQKIGIRDIEG